MSNITSLESLIDIFEDLDASEQIKALKKIDIPLNEFKKFATWRAGDYTRNCIVRRDGFEFILLCWDHESTTPIHGHANQDCWVYQVSGEITETRFKEESTGFTVTNQSTISQGEITYMHDRMGYHKIENTSGKRAMTLHVYANPIDKCKVFNEELSKFEVKELAYDSVGEVVMAEVG